MRKNISVEINNNGERKGLGLDVTLFSEKDQILAVQHLFRTALRELYGDEFELNISSRSVAV